MNFDECFAALVSPDREGDYANDPRDPGGETKYGISKRSYPHLDIKNLTLSDAKEIYRRDVWERAQCSKLPPGLAFNLFDGAVNSGVEQSVRWLQRAVGVADDGHVGPLTLAQVNLEKDPSAILARFNGHRLEFMTKLSKWDVFGRGWARRIATNLKESG